MISNLIFDRKTRLKVTVSTVVVIRHIDTNLCLVFSIPVNLVPCFGDSRRSGVFPQFSVPDTPKDKFWDNFFDTDLGPYDRPFETLQDPHVFQTDYGMSPTGGSQLPPTVSESTFVLGGTTLRTYTERSLTVTSFTSILLSQCMISIIRHGYGHHNKVSPPVPEDVGVFSVFDHWSIIYKPIGRI